MPFTIIRANIVRLSVDAIVNPSNTYLEPGSLDSTSGQIFEAAGPELLDACREIGFCPIGDAVITPGFRLPAKYVIHVAGPKWLDGLHKEPLLLEKTYHSALELAHKNKLKTIAIPLLSAGSYGYPKDKALVTAVNTIQDFLKTHTMDVTLVVYDKTVYQLSEKLSYMVHNYLEKNYEPESHFDDEFFLNTPENRMRLERSRSHIDKLEEPRIETQLGLDDTLRDLDISFSDYLFKLIDTQNLSDPEVYKGANLSRQVFSKIRKPGYQPSKNTAMAFCIALKLDLKESESLLDKAGFSFSRSSKQDLIVRYFIESKNYDIGELNATLFEYDQGLLGSGMN